MNNDEPDKLINKLSILWNEPQECSLLSSMIHGLDARYRLSEKIKKEPGVEEIIIQMTGRLADALEKLSSLKGMKILDIACGSNTSKLPASVHINTPFGELNLGPRPKDYTALFEPWFCRMLRELRADPVGVDLGDLEGEAFTHYRVDLGRPGALDFLPEASFDGIQDSRLFGSPEFTSEFPHFADRLQVAQEISQQERRLLKPGGILIHSDAQDLTG